MNSLQTTNAISYAKITIFSKKTTIDICGECSVWLNTLLKWIIISTPLPRSSSLDSNNKNQCCKHQCTTFTILLSTRNTNNFAGGQLVIALKVCTKSQQISRRVGDHFLSPYSCAVLFAQTLLHSVSVCVWAKALSRMYHNIRCCWRISITVASKKLVNHN